jgi:hypothetical protein
VDSLATGALGVDKRRTRIRSERGTRPPDTWSGLNLSMKVKHVCQRCNNRWMSALETRVQSFLRHSLQGHPPFLSPRLKPRSRRALS